MRNTFGFLATAAMLATFSGCATLGHVPPPGIVYTRAKAVGPSTRAIVSDGARPGTKSAKACTRGVLGLVSWGDMSLATAKAKAGITKVDTVDFSSHNILGAWMVNCTLITGE